MGTMGKQWASVRSPCRRPRAHVQEGPKAPRRPGVFKSPVSLAASSNPHNLRNENGFAPQGEDHLMARNTRKQSRWGKVRGWRQHGFACWDAEWAEYQKAAELAGKSVNGWIRDALREVAKYERVLADERESTGA